MQKFCFLGIISFEKCPTTIDSIRVTLTWSEPFSTFEGVRRGKHRVWLSGCAIANLSLFVAGLEDKKWWRRRELNPRPKQTCREASTCLSELKIVDREDNGSARVPLPSPHERVSARHARSPLKA